MSKDPSSVELRVSALEAERDRLVARVTELEAALDELSRWPPGEGMLEMCQRARAALGKETLPPGTVVQFDPDEETPEQAVERAKREHREKA